MALQVVNVLRQSVGNAVLKEILAPSHGWLSGIFTNARFALPYQQCRHYSFFQLDKVFSFKRLQEERLRLQDEMERGYFDDIKDLKKNLGKLGPASKGLLPVATSATFPVLSCRAEDGSRVVIQDSFKQKDVTLACVAFRQNAQPMVDSWNLAFEQELQSQATTQLIELSVVESIFLRPFQSQLVKSMSALRRRTPPVKTPSPKPNALPEAEKQAPLDVSQSDKQAPLSNPTQSTDPPPKQLLLYHFADTWGMRRALNMPNRLTAYALLVDSEGRVRWRATGLATKEEVTSLQRATRLLLTESAQSAARAKRAGASDAKGSSEDGENQSGDGKGIEEGLLVSRDKQP